MFARNTLVKFVAPILLLSSLPVFGNDFEIAEIDAVSSANFKAVEAEKAQQSALWSRLQDQQAGAEYGELRAVLPEADKALLYGDPSVTGRQSELIGIQIPIDRHVDLSPGAFYRKGFVALGQSGAGGDGGHVWTSSILAEGATGMRIHFANFDLPEGAELYLYNDDGQAHGPYTGKGPHGDGEFWSKTVFGEHAWLQIHSPRELDRAVFDIAAVSHLGDGFEIADRTSYYGKADCSGNVACVENAECYGLDDILRSARKGVAKMIYEEDGGSWLCSGGLLNDQDSSDRKAWFLTAAHCIDTESSANSLETFFQYKYSCGSCSASYVDSVLGADLWAHGEGSAGDFSLLELSELPSSWTLMGWTTAAVYDDPGTLLYRISHPKGKPQSYTQHEVLSNTNATWIKTDPIVGTTEGGSSGSPIFRGDRKVVGQLYGVTYSGSYDLCDNTTFNNRDGALANYWKSVRPYLASPSNTNKTHVSAVTAGVKTLNLGIIKLYFGKATVTVVDELGNPVPRALVTGTFSSGLSGSFSGTTDHDGTVTIQHSQLKNFKPSFTFCVTNVTQDFFSTYDSASNDVTCASR